jgi:hypothetical protein
MSAAVSQSAFSLERLQSASLSSTVEALKGVVRNPTGNTTLSIVVLVCVVLAVLLLVIFAVMLITPSRKQVVKVRRYAGPPPEGAEAAGGGAAVAASAEGLRREEALQRTPPSRVFLALTGWIAVTVLVVLAIAGAYVTTSLDAYCAKTCHTRSDMVAKAESIGHASCVSCHEDGPFSILANISSRAEMLVAYGLGRSPSISNVAVDSYACLRCHDSVGATTVSSKAGVRMSHKEVVEAGQPCSACHAESGHTKDAFTGSMSTCLPCHDAKTAPAKCSTCHTKDVGAVAFVSGESREGLGSGKIVFPAVRAANRRCGECHRMQKECDNCHGVRMPHSNGFIEGAHARSAAFTGKVKCWTCHDPQWCASGCHGAFSPDGTQSGHAGDWEQLHKEQEWSGGCICHSQRGKRDYSMCYLCHDPKTHALLPIRQ